VTHPDDDELLRLVSEVFDDEVGDPPDRLIEAAKALMTSQHRPEGAQAPPPGVRPPDSPDELADRRVHRLERRLAAATATASRQVSGSFTSADGSITTEMTENDQGRLRVSIRSPDTSVLYVAMAWCPISVGRRGRRYRLVTPLAPDRSGLSVHYDLGPLDGCDAVDCEPAEEVFVTAVQPEDVTLALSLATTGASRRAWARAEEIHRANGDPLAEVIDKGMAP